MKVFSDINDLTYFHKIINNQIPLNIPEYIKPYTGQSRLRQTNFDDMSYVCTYNSSSFPSCRSPFYKSFFYRVVHTWNSIPSLYAISPIFSPLNITQSPTALLYMTFYDTVLTSRVSISITIQLNKLLFTKCFLIFNQINNILLYFVSYCI